MKEFLGHHRLRMRMIKAKKDVYMIFWLEKYMSIDRIDQFPKIPGYYFSRLTIIISDFIIGIISKKKTKQTNEKIHK